MSQPYVFLQRTVTVILFLAGGFVFLRWLLMPLLPFLLALALAAVAEPLVQRVRRTMKVRRSFAAATVTTGLLAAAGGTVGLLLNRLFAELAAWSAALPGQLSRLPGIWNSMLDRVLGWYEQSPALLRSGLDLLAGHLISEDASLPLALGERLAGAVSQLLSALPDTGFFLVTTVLAVYFTSLSYPSILAFLKRQLPASWQPRCRKAAQCFRSTVLKWLRAEGLLLLTTFLIQLAGLSLLRVEYALLAASFIALVDALPVLGAGTVLLPWSLLALLTGRGSLGVSLLLLYGVTLLTHALLEPRLLAGQVGLPPISALLAMYLGFHFMGIGGMLLLPLSLLLAKQLQDAGVIRLWK